MVQYNFKKIAVVPNGKELNDIILSQPFVDHNLATPTPFDKITDIRFFYMMKIKFTLGNARNKLFAIFEEFPPLDPFYGDLLSVLYNTDDYKLALGELKTAGNLMGEIGWDFVEQLKTADSLAQCMTLKVNAFTSMRTRLKKITSSLAYLEQIRQDMAARLPSIDPNTRTFLICGYPNVGKTSFLNKVTRSGVDVQPFAFTTKSLLVGDLGYKYTRYQVIVIPGILDRPFEEDCNNNIIEMKSITALAHLRAAAVLFFLDISGSCGYTIAQQAALFHSSIKPHFMNKPLLIVCNKTDLMPLENISEEDRKLIEEMKVEAMKTAMGASEEAVLLTMSTLTGEGVMSAKNAACERLFDQSVEAKMKFLMINDDHLTGDISS